MWDQAKQQNADSPNALSRTNEVPHFCACLPLITSQSQRYGTKSRLKGDSYPTIYGVHTVRYANFPWPCQAALLLHQQHP